MAQVYFHCSNTRGVLIDRRGSSVTGLSEACEAATCMMRALVASASLEDWRDWAVHVSDEAGEEIVILSFASVLGKPHRRRAMSSSQSSLLLLGRGLHAITAGWQKLIARMCDPYRPEQHYMRGPGPKSRAKHTLHGASAG